MFSIEIIKAASSVVAGIVTGGTLVAFINRRKTAAEAGKANAEADKTKVDGDLGIVDRYSDWNQQLLAERDKLISRIETLESKFTARFEKMDKEIDRLEKENEELRYRCRSLEKEKESMQQRIDEAE